MDPSPPWECSIFKPAAWSWFQGVLCFHYFINSFIMVRFITLLTLWHHTENTENIWSFSVNGASDSPSSDLNPAAQALSPSVLIFMKTDISPLRCPHNLYFTHIYTITTPTLAGWVGGDKRRCQPYVKYQRRMICCFWPVYLLLGVHFSNKCLT